MMGWLVNNELQRIYKESLVYRLKVLHRYSTEGTKENYESPQLG
jgi:hypothetical protein